MKQSSTQDFLEFQEIKQGIIILKDKSLRSVIMVSSLNFVLKSTEQQNAILYQFQNFLNSLDFFCEIVIQSRRINIIGYLDKLKELAKTEKNELLKIQITEYGKFIKDMVKSEAIMQKTFYVIIPFSLMETRAKGKQSIPKIPALTEEMFQRAKIQLLQRVEFVSLGLRSCGLSSVPLNTLELIELFWSLNHPAEAERGYYPQIPPELTE